ncbi:hypothetical protein HY570_03125 [Candidatus Micrarchaeota archaeon]|nr:hypothetical protein [Candidatus Micrarchaeota archaeon]
MSVFAQKPKQDQSELEKNVQGLMQQANILMKTHQLVHNTITNRMR